MTGFDDQIAKLQSTMASKGIAEEEIHELIAATLDALIDWSEVLPGEAGQVVESVDGPIWSAILGVLDDAIDAVGDAAEAVGDLFRRRSRTELLAAALEASEKGKVKKAARLSRRAGRR